MVRSTRDGVLGIAITGKIMVFKDRIVTQLTDEFALGGHHYICINLSQISFLFSLL